MIIFADDYTLDELFGLLNVKKLWEMLISAQVGVLEPKYTQFCVTEEEGNQKLSACNNWNQNSKCPSVSWKVLNKD